MSKILVIGASSFTGRVFCEYCRENDHEVIETSMRLPYMPNLAFDYVVNFAALNVVAPSWLHEQDYFRVNVGSIVGFKNSFNPNLRKYVHISTPEVYGNAGVNAITEDTCFAPSTPYAVSRAAAEMMLQCYRKQYGLPVCFTRAANAYGPEQQLYRLIPKLIVSIKKGIKFPLEGGGNSYRQFVHVRDLADAYYRVMMRGVPGEAYHVGSDHTWSIESLVKFICARLKVQFTDAVEFVPERPGKDPAYILDSTKIKALGWEELWNMNTGLESVIVWVEKNWDKLKDMSMEYEYRP